MAEDDEDVDIQNPAIIMGSLFRCKGGTLPESFTRHGTTSLSSTAKMDKPLLISETNCKKYFC
jgi:hypothetical protein